MNKGIATMWVVLLVAASLAIGVGGYYLYNQLYPTKEAPSVVPTTPTGTTSAVKSYTDRISGISFEYPASWTVVEDIGLPEGSAIAPVFVHFAVPVEGRPGVLSFNDISVRIYYRGNATQEGFDSDYEFATGEVQDQQGEIVKVGQKNGTRYDNLGAIASNPTMVVVKEGSSYFVIIRDAKMVDPESAEKDQIFDKLLKSFKFPD